jgi:plastocyanin domain-containing protein
MRMRVLWIGLCLAGLMTFAGCAKKDADSKKAPATAPVTAGAVGADGVRHVSVEANKDGYVPAKITGKPGEKLVLVFTRTIEADCLSQLKTPDGKMVDLPMNQAVDVAVTVPASGKLDFACGMDMFHGEIVAQPGA